MRASVSTPMALLLVLVSQGSPHAASFCYLKGDVQLAACDVEHGVDLFVRDGAGAVWKRHPNTYCFKGHGATDLSPDLGPSYTLDLCEAACAKMPNCTAVSVPAAPPKPETAFVDVFGSSDQICTGAQMVASAAAPHLPPLPSFPALQFPVSALPVPPAPPASAFADSMGCSRT